MSVKSSGKRGSDCPSSIPRIFKYFVHGSANSFLHAVNTKQAYKLKTNSIIIVLVLQGNIATKLSYGGKFFVLVISHFFLIPTLKEFKKSTNICQSCSKNKSGPVFLTHNVYHVAQVLTYSLRMQITALNIHQSKSRRFKRDFHVI